jgi:demethylmenaquinone methyltransferase/2-methoxy-6-polyprenyl-1,4-benzoquinol methylase
MVRSMFDRIAPRYDLVNRLMTFGLDQGWRRRAIGLLALAPPSLVLDLACGTGDFARELASSGFRSIGADVSFGMLAAARVDATPLVEADGAQLPFADGTLDGIVSGFAVRNFADLRGVLDECGRVLRPGGRLALLEVDTPTSPLLRLGHRVWFTVGVPRLGALLSDKDAYRYLPRSVAYLPSRADLLAGVTAAGFVDARHHELSGGITQVVTATRLGARPLSERPSRPGHA